MRSILRCLLLLAISNVSSTAQNHVIVRDSLGKTALQATCVLLNCTVLEGIDGSVGQVFLVAAPANVSLSTFLNSLLRQTGIVDAELDRTLHLMQSQPLTAPSGLWDTAAVTYYGTTVWHGYVAQPAVGVINLQAAQALNSGHVTGAGIVAVIDTGLDPTHPVLQSVLVQGQDFTRNQPCGSELADISQETVAVVNGAQPVQVNQETVAVVNGQGSSTFSQPQYSAFGHGTMTAGIVHLVAPTAQIMPLKAFRADGTGKLSDVIRAIHYAAQNNASVLNMSFDFTSDSPELDSAVRYATNSGAVGVASVGNDGQAVIVYPAGLSKVIGVASTTNSDALSSFSNFGQPPVWLGAPGEGIISTYPYGTYAAGWGTSFSAPFVAGTVALLQSVQPGLSEHSAANALSHAEPLTPSLGYGRLDVYQAVSACLAPGGC